MLGSVVAAQTAISRTVDLPPLTASANLDRVQPRGDNRTIDVTLSRPLTADEGELVLVIDDVDVTALSERTESRVLYRPTTPVHPTAKNEVVLYRRIGGTWNEIRRFSVRAAQAVRLPGLGTIQRATTGTQLKLQHRIEGEVQRSSPVAATAYIMDHAVQELVPAAPRSRAARR